MRTQRDGDSEASAPEPRRQPSGSRQGFVPIVGSRACSWRRFDCPQRRRCFGTGTDGAISRGKDGSFGPRQRRVLDDVGVRFGGSEHHRIETSSSHTRPPLYAAGHPATGTQQTALFGAPRALFHRDQVRRPLRRTQGTVPPGYGNRHSSERRAHDLTGTGNSALFGAMSTPFRRDRELDALRSNEHPIPPGHGNRHSSERRAHDLTGTGNRTSSEARHPTPPGQGTGPLRRRGTPSRPGQCPRPRWQGTPAPGARQPALFGAPRARPRRSPANGALRSTASQAPRDRELGALRSIEPPTPPEQGTRSSSEPRAPHSTGTGNRTSSEVRHPTPPGQGTGPLRRCGTPSHRVRTSLRDGHPAHWGWQTALLGAPTATLHRDPANGVLRSTARQASFGTGTSSSSEPGRPEPTGTGNLDLLGGPAPPTSAGQGTSASPRQPSLLGAPRARNRDWNPGPLRRLGHFISRDTGHPASRGRATGDSRVGTSGLYAPRFGEWRSATETGFGRHTSVGQDGNDRRATAAVMRYGC